VDHKNAIRAQWTGIIMKLKSRPVGYFYNTFEKHRGDNSNVN